MKTQEKRPKEAKKIIEQITVNRLEDILTQNSHTIIDVRDPKSIEKQGNIPGAINLPLDTIKNVIDRKQEGYNPIFDTNKPFLFCCTGGVMSYMAAIKAQENGIEKVCNLDGGHAAWLKLKETQALV